MTEKDKFDKELSEALSRGHGPRIVRFALACLGGVPIAGGVFGGAAGAWSEADQEHYNKVFASWLKLQEDELKEIAQTIAEILSRLNLNDENVRKRIESPEYLSLIKKCFRDWSAAESEEKRVFTRNLLTNAAVHRLCSDDVVRMFIKWIDIYSEPHFAVIRYVYKNVGATRIQIWSGIHGAKVREDSAEADLFKLLIFDLSTGHVIRQNREKDYYGNFIKQPPKPRGASSQTMTSAFDDEKRYELTELGVQFARYTMEGVMPSISSAHATPETRTDG
ncbi:MAG TPA: hypothetical protein VMI32_05165 [Candidatus Solibacter sp.]|nr:hypothetical protein [Candidatus Solibacter sp.]